MTKDFHKSSVSARVRRRNNSGYQGQGTPSAWVKQTPYGSYEKKDYDTLLKEAERDKLGRVIGSPQLYEAYTRKRVQQDLAQYRRICPKDSHPGSKTYRQMYRYLKDSNSNN